MLFIRPKNYKPRVSPEQNSKDDLAGKGIYLSLITRTCETAWYISLSDLPGGRCHGHFPQLWPYKKGLGREKLVAVKVAVSDLDSHDTNIAKSSKFILFFIKNWKPE